MVTSCLNWETQWKPLITGKKQGVWMRHPNSWTKKSRPSNTMNSRLIPVFFLALLLFAGCAKKTVLYSTDEVMEEFDPNYFDFDFLSSRSRIVLEESNGKTTKGTLNLRAKKDSIIWFSL